MEAYTSLRDRLYPSVYEIVVKLDVAHSIADEDTVNGK